MTKENDAGIGIHIYGENSHTKDAIQSVITGALQVAGFSNVTGVNGHGEPCHVPTAETALSHLAKKFPKQFATPVTVMTSLPDDERNVGSDPREIVESRDMMKSLVGSVLKNVIKEHEVEQQKLFHEAGRLSYQAGLKDGQNEADAVRESSVRAGFEAGRVAGYCAGAHDIAKDLGDIGGRLMEAFGDEFATVVENYQLIIELEEDRRAGNPISKGDLNTVMTSIGSSFAPANAKKPPYYVPGPETLAEVQAFIDADPALAKSGFGRITRAELMNGKVLTDPSEQVKEILSKDDLVEATRSLVTA